MSSKEIDSAIQTLEGRLPAKAADAGLRLRIGVLYASRHGWAPETRLIRAARQHLKQAIQVDPRLARAHALLGYLHDCEGRLKPALECMREARRLNPRDKIYEVYHFRLLAANGQEKKALAAIKAAAPRHGVDLARLRRDLVKAGMRADAHGLFNGFIHARNFFRSRLEREAERILNALKPGRAKAQEQAEARRCAKDQRELGRSFDRSRVPHGLLPVASWAARYGVGDDVCRPYLLKRLSKKQQSSLIRDVDEHAKAIQEWLDTFGKRTMPPEAAAYLYLALGVEEIRGSG